MIISSNRWRNRIALNAYRLVLNNHWSLVSRDSKIWKILCANVLCKWVRGTARHFDGARLISKDVYWSAVINSGHIEPRQFLEDARQIMLECVQSIMQRHNNIKLNTVFNGEFVYVCWVINVRIKVWKTTNFFVRFWRMILVVRGRGYPDIAGGIPGTR